MRGAPARNRDARNCRRRRLRQAVEKNADVVAAALLYHCYVGETVSVKVACRNTQGEGIRRPRFDLRLESAIAISQQHAYSLYRPVHH